MKRSLARLVGSSLLLGLIPVPIRAVALDCFPVESAPEVQARLEGHCFTSEAEETFRELQHEKAVAGGINYSLIESARKLQADLERRGLTTEEAVIQDFLNWRRQQSNNKQSSVIFPQDFLMVRQ